MLANLIPCGPSRGRLNNDALNAELRRNDHGGLLSDDESGPVSVRADISRRDGQVGNFEPTHAIHIQLRIDDTTLLARLHRARTKLIHNRKRKGTVKCTSSMADAPRFVESGAHRVPRRMHCTPAQEKRMNNSVEGDRGK